MSYNKNKKGPLFFTTALFFAMPVCLAESAIASASTLPSSFGQVSSQQVQLRTGLQGPGFYATAQQQLLGLLGIQTTSPVPLLPTGLPNLGGKQSPFRLLTSNDLSTLQSTLSKYKTQLETLKSTEPADPNNKADVDALIKGLEKRISQLEVLINDANTAYQKQLDAQETLKLIVRAYANAQANEASAKATADTETLNYVAAQQTLQEAQAASDAALTRLELLKNALATTQENYNLADAALTQQITITNQSLTELNAAQATKSAAEQELITAQQNYNDAATNKQEALDLLNTAQANYDNNLIPDPNWIAPTQQVAHTTFTQQTIPNLLFNSDFSRGNEGWSGLSIGWQNSQPGYFNSNIVFSYTNQTVSQGLYSGPFENATLVLSADWYNDDSNRNITDDYSMTVEAWDIDHNPVGSATYNSTGRHDWENKSVTLTATGSVSYITVSFSGIDNGYWLGDYGPRVKNPVLKVSHGDLVETTTYTTEPVTSIEKTIDVDINEGGQATFTAPSGATFVSSNLRYEAVDNPQLGTNIYPNIQGLSEVTIEASNGVWGDPCGGWYKHVVGTLTYMGTPTAPLVHDPALLPALEQAQANYEEAYNNFSAKEILINSAQTTYEEASSNELTVQNNYNLENSNKDLLTTDQANAKSAVDSVTSQVATAQSESDTAANTLAIASTNKATAESASTTANQAFTQAQATSSSSLSSKTSAEAKQASSEVAAQEAYDAANNASSISFTEVQDLINKQPEPGAKEIPAILTPEVLMSVDLSAVDPTTLTEAQAEQLVEAALETFETAPEGSPEYEQALDALYLAAEQDDITLSPELAAIPGLAAATELVNFFGNAGADMSPETREESKKVVVTAVVAAGAAIQSAAAAATTASAGAASSGGSRRVGK